jgi:hypothetical protein
MKTTLIRMLVLLLLVATLVSCETLMSDGIESPATTNDYNNSPEQQESPDTKFIGTWVYSDKNFSETAKKLGFEGWPSDSKLELAFSFRPDGTGTFTRTTSFGGKDTENQQEFIWYYDTSYFRQVWAIIKDNTAESYNLLYENELFLTMNTTDLGTMFFAKKQQGLIEQ